MKIFQHQLTLKPHPRGFHLITGDIEAAFPEIQSMQKGICQVFIQHTSASLTLNEDADPTVRRDFETFFNKLVPEHAPGYLHDAEGPDDMPAHLKASLLGASVMIPISKGRFALGTWQGVYLCEHRNHGTARRLLLTAWGE